MMANLGQCGAKCEHDEHGLFFEDTMGSSKIRYMRQCSGDLMGGFK